MGLILLGNFFQENPTAAVVTGLALLATMYLTLRPRKKRRRDPLEDAPQRLSLSQQRNVERQVQQIMVDLSEMSREVLGQLDTRAAKIEALIRDADQKIAELRQLQRETGSTGERPVQRLNADDDAHAADVSTDSFPADPTIPDPRHDEIYQLADEGLGTLDIARKLDRPHGEVELILALRERARG